MSPQSINVVILRDAFGSSAIGHDWHYVDVLPSTNDEALERGVSATSDGLVVIADWQSAGRGRFGRAWHAPRGASVLCSIVRVSDGSPNFARRLSLAAPVAICEAIRHVSDVRPSILWPNDILVGERKLAGVLIESRPGADGRRVFAVGMGINVHQHANHFPEPLRSRATSVDLETGTPVARMDVLRALMAGANEWLVNECLADDDRLWSAWQRWSMMAGRRVRLTEDGRTYSGVAVEIDRDAGLIVQIDDGGRRRFDPDRTTLLNDATGPAEPAVDEIST